MGNVELQEEIEFYKEKLLATKDMAKRTTAYLYKIENELKEKNKEISESIDYAKSIQYNLLPKKGVFNNFFSEAEYIIKQRSGIGGDMIFTKKRKI